MIAISVEQLYHTYIEPIPAADQLRLIALMNKGLTRDSTSQPATKTHSLLELEGLGAEIWNGIDAQEYVNALRDEWEVRS